MYCVFGLGHNMAEPFVLELYAFYGLDETEKTV